jgi:hypothetical protein
MSPHHHQVGGNNSYEQSCCLLPDTQTLVVFTSSAFDARFVGENCDVLISRHFTQRNDSFAESNTKQKEKAMFFFLLKGSTSNRGLEGG